MADHARIQHLRPRPRHRPNRQRRPRRNTGPRLVAHPRTRLGQRRTHADPPRAPTHRLCHHPHHRLPPGTRNLVRCIPLQREYYRPLRVHHRHARRRARQSLSLLPGAHDRPPHHSKRQRSPPFITRRTRHRTARRDHPHQPRAPTGRRPPRRRTGAHRQRHDRRRTRLRPLRAVDNHLRTRRRPARCRRRSAGRHPGRSRPAARRIANPGHQFRRGVLPPRHRLHRHHSGTANNQRDARGERRPHRLRRQRRDARPRRQRQAPGRQRLRRPPNVHPPTQRHPHRAHRQRRPVRRSPLLGAAQRNRRRLPVQTRSLSGPTGQHRRHGERRPLAGPSLVRHRRNGETATGPRHRQRQNPQPDPRAQPHRQARPRSAPRRHSRPHARLARRNHTRRRYGRAHGHRGRRLSRVLRCPRHVRAAHRRLQRAQPPPAPRRAQRRAFLRLRHSAGRMRRCTARRRPGALTRRPARAKPTSAPAWPWTSWKSSGP